MERLSETLESSLPLELRKRFAEGCQRSLKKGGPVPVEGSYRNEADRDVLFRCVMIPVRAINDAADSINSVYSLRIAS